MLVDFTGPANDLRLFDSLPGETITGVLHLQPNEGAAPCSYSSILLVFQSGFGVRLLSNGAFWKVMPDACRNFVQEHRQALTDQLGLLPK